MNDAIILAGGYGTRLRAVVADRPKVLALVNGRPFIHYLLDKLGDSGVSRVILATGYLAEQIQQVCGNSWNGMAVVYSRETTPLGTGGAIRLAMQNSDCDDYLVLNGDTWLDVCHRGFRTSWLRSGTLAGMALAKVGDVSRYGAVVLEGQLVAGFQEKRTSGTSGGLINAGTYLLSREIFSSHEAGSAFSFEKELLPSLVIEREVFGFTDTSSFVDIGIPEDYMRAQDMTSFRALLPGHE